VRSVDEFGEAAYTGLRRGLSPLSGASQYAVVQQVRALPGDVRRAASDSGVSEALVDYAARTGDNFRELAQYVTPDGYVSVLRLRRADGSGYVGDTAGETIIGRTVAEAGLPEARTDEIVRRFGDRFKSTEQLDRFGDALRRANRDTEFVEQFSPREAADLADAGFLRSTVEIFDMGFSRQRIDELLARGVSPNAINDGLREYAYAPGRLTETAQEGDIGEVLADAIVIRRQSRYADSERYRILPVDADKDANGINLDPNTVGEFDHVVVDQRSGKVVAVYETKIKSSLDGGEDAPAVQARDTIENLLTDDDATVSPSFLDKSQFRDTDIESLGIGPNDVTYETDGSIPYSNAELRALFESITASDVTKSDIQAVAERTAS
jgi:hypothetical protein